MTETRGLCELNDTDLDLVCGGVLFNGPIIEGPLVSFTDSFNTFAGTNVQILTIADSTVSGSIVGQVAANIGIIGSTISRT